MSLNIVFISKTPFPVGLAYTKRRRYMIDYLCSQENISVLNYSSWNNQKFENPPKGLYKGCVEYINTQHPSKISALLSIAKEGKKILKNRFRVNSLNIVIFSTVLSIEQIPMFLYARKLGYKIVFDVVENYNSRGGGLSLKGLISYKIGALFYKSADGFLVISKALFELFKMRCPQIPICLMPNSTPLLKKNDKQFFSSPLKILYVGTFAEKDGLKYLIKGFDLFCQKIQYQTELILIGKGLLDNESQNIINKNSSIKLLGYVDDDELIKYLNDADILTMTRCNSAFANYGFPFKLSEYLATGNTVIATRVGDVTDYLGHKKNAYLISPESPDEIAETLIEIVSNPKNAIEIGKNGQDVVEKYFSINKNGEALVGFISEL